MAYAVSAGYKTIAKSKAVFWKSKIHIVEDDVDISGDDYLQKWTLKNYTYDENDGTLIGNTIAKMLELQLINTSDYVLENKEIELYSGVVLNPTADESIWNIEYVPHGNFIIQPVENREVPAQQRFVAYDYMVKFNKQFSVGALTYPTTPLLLLQHICTLAGVTLATTSFTNDDFEITVGDAFVNYTCREVLSSICKVSGTTAIINRDNELELLDLGSTSVETIDGNHYITFEKNKVWGELNELTLNSYDIDGENVTENDATSISTYGLTPLNIQEQLIMYTQDLRTTAITDLWTKLFQIKYTPFKMKVKSFNYLDPLDKVTIKDVDDNSYTTYVFNQTIIFDMGSMSNEINTPALTLSEVELKFKETQSLINQRTEIIVNKHEGQISLVAKEVEGLTDFIRNVGTTGDYIKLTDTPLSNGAVSNLSIKGFDLIGLYPGLSFPGQYTYPGALSFYTLVFDTVNTFNATPKYVYINSPIPLQKIATTYDEISIVGNNVSIIQRIGYSGTTPTVLSTPIVHDLGSTLLPTFDGDTYIKVLAGTGLIFNSTYMQKNALTNVFATQLESSAVLSITNDRINSKVSKDGVISEINQSPEQISINANKISLEGVTTINNGFSVDLDGNATMQDATIYGDIYIPSTTSKVIGNLGIFGALHISQKGLIGQEFSSISGGYAFSQNVIKFVFYIPETFTVSKAYIVLKQTKTKHIPVMADDVDGKLTTVNLYSGTTERTWIVSDYWDAQASAFEDNNDLGTIITSAFNNYTAPNIYSNTVLSTDISSSITTGINNLFINNGSVTELFEASSYPDPTSLINARLPKSCYAYADLIIYGYDKTQK